MSLRLRRSVKLAPGLRLNFSGSGVSLSAGPRGATMNFGSRGTYLSTGIPGTGLYSRTRIDSPAPRSSASSTPQQTVMVKLQITCQDDGTVRYEYDGKPASEYLISKARRTHGEAIRAMLGESCDKMNALGKALGEIHRYTPAPTERVKFVRREFEEPPPKPPIPRKHGLLGWLFKRVASRIDASNRAAELNHQVEMTAWESRKKAFEAQEDERERFLEHQIFTEPSAMEKHLEQALQDIAWPRETHVSFEVADGGRALVMDVDLPEIEDLPKTVWSLPATGYKPSVKKLSEGQIAKMYADHVQGVGFRIIGEAFALLPSVETITLSAYTQRPSPATGAVQDDYVYSVKVQRAAWSRISFQHLAALDVSEALAQFDLRRDMLKGGRLKAIQPFTAPQVVGVA